MKRTIRENIIAPYSLHDMNVISFEIEGDNLIMRTQSGMIKCGGEYSQPEGYVEFQKVDWDFCYAYVLDTTANEATFTGEKMFLQKFISEFQNAGFSIIDETYGYNQTKYSGWLSKGSTVKECVIEIYHMGNMIFVTEE